VTHCLFHASLQANFRILLFFPGKTSMDRTQAAFYAEKTAVFR
jgi:hypothetical protein